MPRKDEPRGGEERLPEAPGEKVKEPIKGRQGLFRSFVYAYRGITSSVRTQRNMRFHLAAAAVVLAVGLLAGVSALELAILVIVISAVFVTEMINTALEFVVDLVTREYHPLAKLSKDVSAGAVLVASIAAVLVGCLILADDLSSFLLKALELWRS